MLMLAQIIAAGQVFVCTPVRVWDGDGPIWCMEGPRIRLAGIAAREMDGSCRPSQPCPDGSAEAARNRLVGLLGRPAGRSREGHVLVAAAPLSCRSTGAAGGDRTGAWCITSRGVDLSCAMIASGHALR